MMMSEKKAAEILAKLVMAKPRAAIAYLREEVIVEACAAGYAEAIETAAKRLEQEADRYHEDPRGAVFDDIAAQLRAEAKRK